MKSKQQTCLLLLNYFLYVCVYEGFVKAPKESSGSTERSTKRREIFFKKEERDRLIEKIAKKQGKKNERFSFAETDDALLTAKEGQLFALELIAFLIFSVTNL